MESLLSVDDWKEKEYHILDNFEFSLKKRRGKISENFDWHFAKNLFRTPYLSSF